MTQSKQMEFFQSTSLQEDTLANLSPLQVEKKVKKIQDTSGQKCLDLSKSCDRLGLLEKTLVGTLNSVSTPFSRTWRVKVTPQGRLVFQLRASVRTTKEKESGLLLTPNAMDSLPPRSEEALKKQYQNNRKGRTTHSTLREQVVYPSPQRMWRTPDNMAGGSNLPGIKKALDEGHLKRPSGQPMQIRLQDQVKEERLWPTPKTSDQYSAHMRENDKGIPHDVAKGNLRGMVKQWPTPQASEHHAGRPGGKMQKMLGNHPDVRGTGGGTLNPTWVEWLMGYPKGWTDLNHSEIVSSLPFPTTSDSASSKPMKTNWPTPLSRDWKDGTKIPPSVRRGTKGHSLATKVLEEEEKMWPTPTNQSAGKGEMLKTLVTKDGKPAKKGERAYNPKTGKHVQITLDRAVAMWPTPTANDGKRGEINEDGTIKDSWKKRKEKWASKGVHMHKPLDIAVALDLEKKNDK